MEGHGNERGEETENTPVENESAKMATAITRMAEYFERQENRTKEAEQSNREDTEDVALVRFLKFHPPKFNGKPDVEEAERWMEALEDIYETLEYAEARKVKFAVFQLEGAAKAWWRIVEQKWELEGTPRTWKKFLEEFKNKFIPLLEQEKKEDEFMNLKQGDKTVAEYEANFSSLSKYAPDMVRTEAKRKRRFLIGLTPELQNALATARMDSYAEAVELAQRAESGQALLREHQESQRLNSQKERVSKEVSNRKQVRLSSEEPREAPNKRPYNQGQVKEEERKVARTGCQHCGGSSHEEENCWWKAGKCLRCGSSKHRIGACPRKKGNYKENP